MIVEIALTVNASLHILDGIVGMDGNGPTNGHKRNTNVILASDNCIALDRVVVELIGKQPEQFPIFIAAKNLKINGVLLEEIDVLGNDISECKIENFEIPGLMSINFFNNKMLSSFIKRIINQKLIIDYNKCIHCRKCEDQCPAKAISYSNNINIDHDLCIRCCCCQEICPVGALSVSDPLPLKVLKKLGF